jgi:hypothetical protein
LPSKREVVEVVTPGQVVGSTLDMMRGKREERRDTLSLLETDS